MAWPNARPTNSLDSAPAAAAPEGAGSSGDEVEGPGGRMAHALERCSYAFCVAAGVAYLAAACLVGLSVGFRYGLNAPLDFAQEVVGYLITFGVFAALGYTFRTEGHVATSILLGRLSRLPRILAESLVGLVSMVFAVALVAATTQRVLSYHAEGTTSHTVDVALWIPALAMVVGALVLLLDVVAWTLRTPQRARRGANAG